MLYRVIRIKQRILHEAGFKYDSIGRVALKGIPEPTEVFILKT